MSKKDGKASDRIRFFAYPKRVTNLAGITMSMREGLPDTCFMAICDHIAFTYPYDSIDSLFAKEQDKLTFESIVQRRCGASDTLFTGELENGVLDFERAAADHSIRLLCVLLRRTFGHTSLVAEACDLVAMNPTIRLGSRQIASLKEVLEDCGENQS